MSQNVNVNLTPGGYPKEFHVSQYDVGRQLVANVVDSTGAYSIPSGATVTLVGTKPSGFGFTLSGSVGSGGVVTFSTTATVTAEYGRIPCELRITSGDTVLGTANLMLIVEESPHQEGVIDGNSETVIPELTILVERVEAAASNVLDMQVEADTLPAGSSATYLYDEETNTATFGIPQGEAGAGAAGVVASAYSASSTYAVGDYVIHDGNLYRCTTAITTAEAFTAAHWTQVVLGDDVSDLKSDLKNITEFGTNIFPQRNIAKNIYGVTATYENGILHRNGTATEGVPIRYGKLFSIDLKAGTYTFSASESNFTSAYLVDSSNNIVSQINGADATFTLTTGTTLWFTLIFNNGATYTNDVKHIQLQSGSEKTAWEESKVTAVDVIARNDAASSKEMIQRSFSAKYIPFVLGNKSTGSQATNRMSLVDTVTLNSGTELKAKGSYLFAVYGSSTLLTQGFVSSYTMAITDNCRLVFKKSDDSDLSSVYSTVTIADCLSVSDISVFYLKGKINLSGNVIYGRTHYKKYCSVGDSITYGYYYNGSTMVQMDDPYGKIIYENMDIDSYYNNSVPSTSISTQSDYSSSANAFVNRIEAIPLDSDLITILGGTNDFGHSTPLGTVADTTDISFYGAVNVLLTGIINRCPNARVIFITPLHRNDEDVPNDVGKTLVDYVNAIKEECKIFGVQVIDGYSESGFNNLDVIKTNFMPDGLHPNPDGHEMFARNIIHNF